MATILLKTMPCYDILRQVCMFKYTRGEFMETLLIDNKDESLALSNINKYLEERIFDKRKKEICLVFSKKPSISFFKLVILAFYDFKSAYLKMIKYEKVNKCILEKTILHSGENITYNEPKIIVGNVHQGATLHINSNIVFIGEVKGVIYLDSEKASIYADKFINAPFIDKNGRKKIINSTNALISFEELEAM